jgi:alkanesulfonate monooxygenase SsuD/methylene tetrahydromethanopterin reductase-like flavin-dependent oxidoreductase (luciferase family)
VVLPDDYAGAIDYGIAHAGSPATVLDRLVADVRAAGASYLVLRFVFGDMTAAEMQASFALFQRHVQPALTAL